MNKATFFFFLSHALCLYCTNAVVLTEMAALIALDQENGGIGVVSISFEQTGKMRHTVFCVLALGGKD